MWSSPLTRARTGSMTAFTSPPAAIHARTPSASPFRPARTSAPAAAAAATEEAPVPAAGGGGGVDSPAAEASSNPDIPIQNRSRVLCERNCEGAPGVARRVGAAGASV